MSLCAFFCLFLFLFFWDTPQSLASVSVCVFEFFSVFLFPGTCLEALLKDWSARDAACMPSFFDPEIKEQYDGSLSLGSQKVSCLSARPPLQSGDLQAISCFFFFAGFVAAGKRVARRRLFAMLTQFYNTEQPKRRRYKRDRERESGTRESERRGVCVFVYIYFIGQMVRNTNTLGHTHTHTHKHVVILNLEP